MSNLKFLVLIICCLGASSLTLLAQKLFLSSYIAHEAEIITETEGLQIDDAVLIPNTQASYIWTPGLKLDYILNRKFRVGIDAVYRPFYSYNYSIYVPYADSPTGYVSGGSGRVVDEITLSVVPQIKIWQLNRFQVWAAIGVGSSFPIIRSGGAGFVDFGKDQESLTKVFNALRLHPHKLTLTGQAALSLSWKRLFVHLRYLRTLSRSATDPLSIDGKTYPYINKRDGLSLGVGYALPIGRGENAGQ